MFYISYELSEQVIFVSNTIELLPQFYLLTKYYKNMKKTLLFFVGVLMSISLYSQGQLHVFQDWASNAGSQNFLFKNRTITDALNNVYVAGATLNGSNYDILVVKYNAKGGQQWIAQYNGAGNGQDIATGLDIDASGNVYITGTVTTATNIDLIVIKYNSSGVQQWLQTYNGTGNTYDSGADIKVVAGAFAGVYVTGGSYNASGNTDFVTIKYSTAGVQLWVKTYNHSSNLNDAAVRIVVRFTGVYVTGAVQTGTASYSPTVVRYNPMTGIQIGVTTGTGGSSGITEVNDMVVDASNNIYITGSGFVTGQGYNYYTIKLSSSLAILWQQTYNGTSNLDDVAKGVQVDASGNVFVTGYTTTTTEGRNWATIKYNSSGIQQWIQMYNDPLNADDEANGIALDLSGNAYVTGYNTTTLNQTDYYTIKYNTSGTVLWEIGTDGNKHLKDVSTNIVIDNLGDIVIAGQSETVAGKYEYLTVKYVEEDIIIPTESISTDTTASYMAYFENKGQLLTVNDTLIPEVRYYTNFSTPEYFIGNRKWSVVFTNADTASTTMDTLCRIDLGFTGNVNPNAKVYPLDQLRNYNSYFFAHIPEGITEVHGNARLVTPDLYPNVDLQYASNQKGFKYYFIVKPGGIPTGIQLEFTGASFCSLDGTTNALTVSSLIGSITFRRPTVYQLSSTNTVIPITTWTADWQTNGASNKYKFNIGTYDNTKPLIIVVDEGSELAPVLPTLGNLSWSTYFGSGGDDQLTETAIGNNSDLYVAGNSYSSMFPEATGTYQTTSGGNQDAIALRFNKLGQLLWMSYVGGTLWETTGGIAVNPSTKNVYLVGTTLSSNFPTSFGNPGGGALYNATIGGGSTGFTDGFICKFDSAALTAPWRSYYGGSGNEYFNDVNLDASNNIFIVGQASSSLTSIASGGAYTQSCLSGGAGDHDGLILKLNSSGVAQWITCYGGTSANEFADRVDFDAGGNVYIVGYAATPGTGFPTLNLAGTSDYYQNTLSGSADAFIAKFNNTGVRTWATLYGGSGIDYATSVEVDKTTGDIFVGGNTFSQDSTVLVTDNGGYHQAFNAGGVGTQDGFLLKLNPSLTRVWGTYFGGNGFERINCLNLDTYGVLYATGETQSTNMPYYPPVNSPSVFDQGYQTGKNGYVSAFDPNQKNVWSSYLGGSKDDVGYSIISDNDEQLFVVGKTNSDTAATQNYPLNNGMGIPYFCGYWQGGAPAHNDGGITRFDIKPNFYIGMEEFVDLESSLVLYPNPGNDYLNVLLKNDDKTNITLVMYDILGKEILRKNLGMQNGDIFHTFDIAGLSSGVYFLQAQCGNNFTNKKFIKQ